MAEAVPLAIYPWPLPPEQLERIRVAFMSLNVPFAVQPVPASPGEPGRVLGMGQVPPFVCDCAYVKDVDSDAQILDRVSWLLTAAEGDRRGFLVVDYLNALLGPGVTELYSESVRRGPTFG